MERLSSDAEFRDRVNAFLEGEGFLLSLHEILLIARNFVIQKKRRVDEHQHGHYIHMKKKISSDVSCLHGYEHWTG